NSVHAETCTGIVEQENICIECCSIRYNKNLHNKIAHPFPLPSNTKFTPKHYWNDNPLKKHLQNQDLCDIWNILNNESKTQLENLCVILADKALKGAFNNMLVFMGLCEVMVILSGISSRALDLFCQNLEDRTIQSIRFKRLTDKINYNGPIATITDNTKLKLGLRYSTNLEFIALIPNNRTDTANSILQLYKQLIIGIVSQLGLHILSLGSDGAITKFQAQQLISKTQTNEKLIVKEPYLNINFLCPIFDHIGPVIHVQDSKYAKKIARNAIMSRACLLTFGNSSAQYNHFLQLIN
ncbi:8625_t:CDS:2, partial [Gigaspora margarita]